ncbi:T9SS type A sorting domain-containing protein [Sediminitomix flava]|uniref:Putative secreted protein (Por secretion system target) n=1 Tax=Sediminitomix flava TaxID=379075 RepID=A0A315ZFV1_SEDFL|nr:T9SS type A sorting domain-containing protein [Sediminitomix flava]PWJ44033.1 putative secreted protein (Por secretion system target) [Sediminitomix flava]
MKRPLLTTLSMMAFLLLLSESNVFAQRKLERCNCEEPSGKPSISGAVIPTAQLKIKNNGEIKIEGGLVVYQSSPEAIRFKSSETSLIQTSGVYKGVAFEANSILIIDAETVKFSDLNFEGGANDSYTIYIKKDAKLIFQDEDPFSGAEVKVFNDGKLVFKKDVTFDNESLVYNSCRIESEKSLSLSDATLITDGTVLGGEDLTTENSLIINAEGTLNNCGRMRFHTSASIQGTVKNCCTLVADGSFVLTGNSALFDNYGTVIACNFTLGEENQALTVVPSGPTLNLQSCSKFITPSLATYSGSLNVDGSACVVCQQAVFKKDLDNSSNVEKIFSVEEYKTPTSDELIGKPNVIDPSLIGLIDNSNTANTCVSIYDPGDFIPSTVIAAVEIHPTYKDIISVYQSADSEIAELDDLLEDNFVRKFRKQTLKEGDERVIIESRIKDIYIPSSNKCNERVICLDIMQCGADLELSSYEFKVPSSYDLKALGISYDDPDFEIEDFYSGEMLKITDDLTTPTTLAAMSAECPDIQFTVDRKTSSNYKGYKIENINYLTGSEKGGEDCESITIDFEEYNAGYSGGNQIDFKDGFITSSFDLPSKNVAMIYDTDAVPPTGDDGDLANGDGKVLIISEDGDATNPDDNAGPGSLIFNFDCDVKIEKLTWIDQEDDLTIILKDKDNVEILNQTVTGSGVDGDVSEVIINSSSTAVRTMEVVFEGSGAIDNIIYEKCNRVQELKTLTLCLEVDADENLDFKEYWKDFDLKIKSKSSGDSNGFIRIGCDWECLFYDDECDDIVTPVQLVSFDVDSYQSDALISWETASEINSSHFEVQRSQHGVNFEKLIEIEALGNSERIYRYEFLDEEPLAGYSYYRIKQVDKDGSYEYSPTRAYFNKITEIDEPILYPNPASEVLNFSQIDKFLLGDGELYLYNTEGKLLEVQSLDQDFQKLDVSGLNYGMYIVELRNSTNSTILKFTK